MAIKQMSSLEIHLLMNWLQEKQLGKIIPLTLLETIKKAEKELGFPVTTYYLAKCAKDLEIKIALPRKVKEKKKEKKLDPSRDGLKELLEFLTRIKRLEKFMELNFPEKWANII
jgi:hypothetical protein